MATEPHLALVLTGGGARAAYQVGFLRYLASRYPNLSPGILTGVSAGGIIATHLASRSGDFAESVDRLFDLWRWSFRGTATVDLAPRFWDWGAAIGIWR